MKFISLICLVIIISLDSAGCLNAQGTHKNQLTAKEKSLFDEARKSAAKGDINNSNKKYEALLREKPDFTEGILRLASNYFQSGQWEKSESLFRKAIKLDQNFDPEMYYSLALVQKEMKKHLEAASNLNEYAAWENSKAEKVKKALRMRDNLTFIDHALKNPVPFIPENLGSHINSPYSEYSPSLSLDGSSIIFTRNTGNEDFYISVRDSAGFRAASPMFGLNTYQNEGAHAVSADGKFMVFTACDRKDSFGSCDLYYSMLIDGKWSVPMNMGHRVNSAAWDSQPTLSADGRMLYFSSRRLGTLGGSDIWVTWRDEKNAWVTPVNLGNIINSEGDDESPFLHADGQTLYFRSDGRPGMGGFDIYFSRKNDSTDTWLPPVNLGYPINTEGSEGSLVVSLDGSQAYFAGDMNYKTGKRTDNLDLYVFELYEAARPLPTTFIRGHITDGMTGKSLPGKVTIKNHANGHIRFQKTADKDGIFMSGITAGQNYICMVEYPGYVYQTVHLNLSSVLQPSKPYILDIALLPVEKADTIQGKETPVILHNIFFKSGSADLLPESGTEITLLIDMMKAHPNHTITITGHTDNIGKEEDNMHLSLMRAQAVANAIMAGGIPAYRISAKGMGETRPIADNTTEEGRQINRRTEFVLSKM